MKSMRTKLKESFNLLLMKMYPDLSEILSSINHEDEKISLLYINITEECTHVLSVSDDHRSCQKLILQIQKKYRNYINTSRNFQSYSGSSYKTCVSGNDV